MVVYAKKSDSRHRYSEVMDPGGPKPQSAARCPEVPRKEAPSQRYTNFCLCHDALRSITKPIIAEPSDTRVFKIIISTATRIAVCRRVGHDTIKKNLGHYLTYIRTNII